MASQRRMEIGRVHPRKGGNKSHVRCHFCKKFGHIRAHCPKLMDKEKNEAYTHMDVALVMDDRLEMDKEDTSYGAYEVQEAVGACSPCECPVKDTMRYPCLSPIRCEEYPKDERREPWMLPRELLPRQAMWI